MTPNPNGSENSEHRVSYLWSIGIRPIGMELERTKEIGSRALEKAAAQDERSASAIVEIILIEWLKTRGFVKPRDCVYSHSTCWCLVGSSPQ
jgi:hypothetical protein